MKRNEDSVIAGFLWRFGERFGAQGVSLAVSVLLARFLEPEVFGSVALVTVFITILNVFVDSGFGNALIQKKDADALDFSTVFYFNLAACVVLYGLVFLFAPCLARFFRDGSLTAVIRVLSLQLIISGVKNVEQAYVSRTMQFRRFFFSTTGGTLGAAVLGILMALRGCGVWALVAQQLFNLLLDTIILWFTVKWRPLRQFSWKRLKLMFRFSRNLLVTELIKTVYQELRQIVIGSFYSSGQLAQFNRGKQFPEFIVYNINSAVDSVLFPTLSKAQDDPARLKSMMRRSIKTTTYLMAPLMMGLAFIGAPVVRFLLTEKWMPCLPYLRIFCVAMMFIPLNTSNVNAVKALGKGELVLKLELRKKLAGTVILAVSIPFGVKAIAFSMLLSSFVSQLINTRPNKQILGYGYREQLRDILPGILTAVWMGVCIMPLSLLHLPDLTAIVLQTVLGGTIYIGLSALLKLDAFLYLSGVAKQWMRNRNTSDEVRQ